MNFRKSSKGGRGVIFNPKIYVTKFRQGYLTMKFEGFVDSLKILQHNFPIMRGGGAKAVWNIFENSSVLEGGGIPYQQDLINPWDSIHQ